MSVLTEANNGKGQNELSIRALILGVILSVVLCAANTYLGLYAGMTVAASIPAAVISMGILRGVFKKASILENNIVQTVASAGESLAAGIIFTAPAFIITGVWEDFNYWVVTAIAILGGLMGIIFMIPMRDALIVKEKKLIFPEGLACAEVLKAGEAVEKQGLRNLIYGIFIGSFLKLLTSLKFFMDSITLKENSMVSGTVEYAFKIKNTVFYLGSAVSGALIGVGYIIGFNVSFMVFLGGAIAYLVGIPIFSAVYPDLTSSPLEIVDTIWSSEIRYLGVGAMIIGGLNSIVSVRKHLLTGIKSIFSKQGLSKLGTKSNEDNENLSSKVIIGILIVVIIGIFALYYYLTNGNVLLSSISTIIMVILSFFLVAISTYLVGIVGSSNNPVSGMTIIALFFTILILYVSRISGDPAIIATLGLAGVVCSAACTSGDVAQDLKTGLLVGAKPKRQQISQIIGTVAAAFIIVPVLGVLQETYGIGTGGPDSLKAPQATLFASIVQTFFNEEGVLNYSMLIGGMGIGIAILLINQLTKRKGFPLYLMPIAVGMYLPLSLSAAILIGGVLNYYIVNRKKKSSQKGILFSSGLIAGEAITGILTSFIITFFSYIGLTTLIPFNLSYIPLISIIIFILFCYIFYRRVK